MELEMKKAQKLEDGTHVGSITKVSYDTEPYEYTRVHVKVEDVDFDIELEYSCPTNLTENSKLMRLLRAFGVEFEPEKKIDPATVLVNQKVRFQVINKPAKKDPSMSFSEIVEDSLKPFPSGS